MPTIVDKQVGATGYGLMGMTWRNNPPPQDQAFRAMDTAVVNGANFWNGAEFYGTPNYNTCHLLNKYFEHNPTAADKVVLSIKTSASKEVGVLDATEPTLRRSLDDCLKALGGKYKIDIFGCSRVDPNTPIETTMEAMKKLKDEGKIGGIGLSEVSAKTIRRAHAVVPIAAVEGELSVWAVDNLENEVLSTCAELGIPFVAYSPLGRGILTGRIKKHEDVPEDNHVNQFPKYRKDVLDKNLQLVYKLEALAEQKGCSVTQLALAWVKYLSGKPGMPVIIPIPGATTEARVSENCKDITMTDAEAKEVDKILEAHAVRGERYIGFWQTLAEG